MPENDYIEPDEKEKLQRVIDEGAEIAGGAIGSALGVITGDPAIASVLGATGVSAGKKYYVYVGSEIVWTGCWGSERENVWVL